jgi:succinyl-CoA synthetase beta subunit
VADDEGDVGERERMNIHEYQAAEILGRYNVPVNAGRVATTPTEARAAAGELGRVAIKAQVHTGGRGKAGGIKLATTPDEAEQVAGRILGMDIRGHTVGKVLVVPAVAIKKEYYLGAILDRANRCVTLMASAEGGVDIEEVARDTPEKIIRVQADRVLGLNDFQARQIAFALGLEGALVGGFVQIAKALYAAFVGEDATLVEINPLILTEDDRWLALDSKITIDDNALFRHPATEAMRDLAEEEPTEIEAKASGISYVKLEGNVGCVVNGAGLAMATMDAVKASGGEPANFLDVGGGASAERVTRALRLVLSDPNVKAVLFNIFGGITRGDVLAQGIKQGLSQVQTDVPIVVRLDGTNAEEGRAILADANLITAATMSEAARKAVEAANGR